MQSLYELEKKRVCVCVVVLLQAGNVWKADVLFWSIKQNFSFCGNKQNYQKLHHNKPNILFIFRFFYLTIKNLWFWPFLLDAQLDILNVSFHVFWNLFVSAADESCHWCCQESLLTQMQLIVEPHYCFPALHRLQFSLLSFHVRAACSDRKNSCCSHFYLSFCSMKLAFQLPGPQHTRRTTRRQEAAKFRKNKILFSYNLNSEKC